MGRNRSSNTDPSHVGRDAVHVSTEVRSVVFLYAAAIAAGYSAGDLILLAVAVVVLVTILRWFKAG